MDDAAIVTRLMPGEPVFGFQHDRRMPTLGESESRRNSDDSATNDYCSITICSHFRLFLVSLSAHMAIRRREFLQGKNGFAREEPFGVPARRSTFDSAQSHQAEECLFAEPVLRPLRSEYGQ
jgi:hypothetical protein